MIYHTKVAEGEKRGDEVFRSENYAFARQAADNYKRDTGVNCFIESRSVVYVTSTLEEAIARGDVTKPMGTTHVGKLAAPVDINAEASRRADAANGQHGADVDSRFRH